MSRYVGGNAGLSCERWTTWDARIEHLIFSYILLECVYMYSIEEFYKQDALHFYWHSVYTDIHCNNFGVSILFLYIYCYYYLFTIYWDCFSTQNSLSLSAIPVYFSLHTITHTRMPHHPTMLHTLEFVKLTIKLIHIDANVLSFIPNKINDRKFPTFLCRKPYSILLTHI